MRDEFALLATRGFRNFAVKATACTESSHAAIKAQLQNLTGDLHVLHTGIVGMLMRQQDVYEHAVNQQKYKALPKTHGKAQYRELQGTVSHFALGQLVKNKEHAKAAVF